MNEEYNEALEWAANWITGSQMLGRSQEVVEFAQSMAMSLRAAKRPTPRAVDGVAVCDKCGYVKIDNICLGCEAKTPPRN